MLDAYKKALAAKPIDLQQDNREWLDDACAVKTPTLSWVTITPAIAGLMLERNGNNRPVKKSFVTFLASEMTAGNWQDAPNAISFSRNGVLIDGQHRLLAIIEAKMTVTMRVFFGENPEAFQVLDCGVKRRVGDVLALAGHVNTTSLAATVKVELQLQNGLRSNDNRSLSSTTVLDALALPGFANIFEAVKIGHKCEQAMVHTRGVNCGLNVAVFRILNANPRKKREVEAFFDKVGNGFDISSNDDPIARLRNRIFDKNNKLHRPELACLTIKTWNFHHRGKTTGRLMWGANEPFPEPISI